MADLILQAIVRPTDAPAEIRAAVADSLARRGGQPAYTWEDVGFAASAVAVSDDGSGALETHWVFALSAHEPKPGEQLIGTGNWSVAISGPTHWRADVFDVVTTEPRSQ